MTEEEQKAKHKRLIDAQSVLMLASRNSWKDSAEQFRDFLDGAFQIAWRAVRRDLDEDKKLIKQAEQVVAEWEFAAVVKSGGKVQ